MVQSHFLMPYLSLSWNYSSRVGWKTSGSAAPAVVVIINWNFSFHFRFLWFLSISYCYVDQVVEFLEGARKRTAKEEHTL